MIAIGTIDNPRAAQALVDYLQGLDIECRLQPDENGVTLYISDHSQLEQAQVEFQKFVENPYQDKYLQASWQHGDSHTKFDYGAPGLQLFSQFMTGAGPVTLTIFAVCCAVFAALNLGFAQTVFNYLSFFGATPDSNINQVWRVFTPSLLHFSALHLIFNLLWWWYLGGKIENKLGKTPLIILLVVAGTLPNIIQYFVAGPDFGGLSGVVYALIGYCYVISQRAPEKGIDLPPAFMGFMLLCLVLGFTDIFGFSVANGAHIGGLVIGLLQGFIDSQRYKKSN